MTDALAQEIRLAMQALAQGRSIPPTPPLRIEVTDDDDQHDD